MNEEFGISIELSQKELLHMTERFMELTDGDTMNLENLLTVIAVKFQEKAQRELPGKIKKFFEIMGSEIEKGEKK